MTESFEQKVWEKLSVIDVNDKIEKKNNLTYLSWAWAWGTLMNHYPQSSYVINEPKTELDGSVMVSVTLTIKEDDNEISRFMWLPVMDYANKAIKNPDTVAINKAIMRCLTKAISMFGLGFYIYAGEDLPKEEKQAQKKTDEEQENKRQTLIDSLEESAKKGVESMKRFWEALTIDDQQIIGKEEKRRNYELAQGIDNGTTTH